MNKQSKNRSVSIEDFILAVEKLPDDDHYKTVWLRWLKGYDDPGPYNRRPNRERDAKFVYNNLAYPEMLLWLIEAAGIDEDLVRTVVSESEGITNVRRQAAAIRKRVPWVVLERALWE